MFQSLFWFVGLFVLTLLADKIKNDGLYLVSARLSAGRSWSHSKNVASRVYEVQTHTPFWTPPNMRCPVHMMVVPTEKENTFFIFLHGVDNEVLLLQNPAGKQLSAMMHIPTFMLLYSIHFLQ